MAAGKRAQKGARDVRPSVPDAAGRQKIIAFFTLWWPLFAVVVVTLIAYANSLTAPFILDNEEIILQDPRVHSLSSLQLHRILNQQYWETAPTGLYRPLTTLSYLFNYTILGNTSDPYGYHWINLGLHLSNLVLVYLLGLALLKSRPTAAILAAIWSLHPIQTESVTNIVGRADLLATFGVLAAVLCHRQALNSAGMRKALWVAAIFVAVAIGVFAKESGIVVLGVLVAYDLTVGSSPAWRRGIPNYIAAGIPCAAYLYVRSRVLAGAPTLGTSYIDNPLLGADFWTARFTALKVLAKYLWLLIWPAGLSYDYSYNQIPLVPPNPGAAVLAVIIGVAVIALVVWSGRRHPVVTFGLAFFAVTFAPTSNLLILIGSIMGERFLYLPSLGLALCFAYCLPILWDRLPAKPHRLAAAAAMAIVLLAFLVRTNDRNGDWLDPHRFWQTGVEAAPNSFKTHINVATTTSFLVPDDWDRAIHHTERALAILDPLPPEKSLGSTYRDSAMIFREVGEQLAARKFAGAASAGTSPDVWYQKALRAILRAEAIELVYDQRYRDLNAAHGRPGLTGMPSKLYLEMGRIYRRLDRPAEAVAAFERGVALEARPELLEEAAAAYEQVGDPQHAVIALEESYTVDSTRPVLSKIVDLYRRISPTGCAVVHQGETAVLNPDCPSVHADICLASRNIAETYVRRGQPLEAGAVRKRAVEYLGCSPDSAR